MAKRYDAIPASHVDILESLCTAHVATIRPDGQLSNHPVSLVWDGEYVRFSTTKGRLKYRNLLADPRVAISVTHPDNAWRYLEIRGTAKIEDDVGRVFIDSIARKYMGRDDYPFDAPGAERVVVTVHPTQVSAADVSDGS